MILAAVEGGGTTFVASIARVVPADHPNTGSRFSIGETSLEIIHTATFPPDDANWTPSQILSAVSQFFIDNRPKDGYSALGIATFGPAGVSPSSPQYGCILNGCPKKEWRGVDVLTPLKAACQVVKVAFDTDVNAPALAEFRHRCHLNKCNNTNGKIGKEQTSLAYVTIGTGVGVGLILNSSPIHGLLHPEGGHCPIQTLPGDTFKGYSWGKEMSPFFGVATVEGVASSVALTERLMQMQQNSKEHRGKRDHSKDANSASSRNVLATLPDDHEIWSHASNAIANLCVTILLLTSCQTIVLGGGVMNRTILYDRIRKETLRLLNGYLDVEELTEDGIKNVICGSAWEEVGSGLVGAFALGLDLLEHDEGVTKKQGKSETTRRSFSSGVLAGIGLCLSALFVSKLVRRQ
jgi:fructokinase